LGNGLFAKRFLKDPETGVNVRLVKYPAGFTNSWHTHPCAMACSCRMSPLSPIKATSNAAILLSFLKRMTMEHAATLQEDVTVFSSPTRNLRPIIRVSLRADPPSIDPSWLADGYLDRENLGYCGKELENFPKLALRRSQQELPQCLRPL
jgi:hypothetical protein